MDLAQRLSSRDRVRAWWALVLVLFVAVYAPLFGAGPVGEDLPVLVEASRALHPELGGGLDLGADLLYTRAGTDARPLAALSLGTSDWLWTQSGVWTPFALALLRLENLFLLLLTAYLLGRFVRRLVVPWTGIDQAVAAGYAAWLLLCVHPLSVSAVASPAARGDLIGSALAAGAGTAFLRGRQERRYGFVVLAALLTLAGTFASELGLLVPFGLALIEYYSSRRYRPGRVRVRTALTTLFVFGAFSCVDLVVRALEGVSPWPAELARSASTLLSFGDFFAAILHAFEKVGVLMVPVNGGGEGGLGYVLAVLALVAVLQPALHAFRSAPRFWATVLLAWLGVILATTSLRASTRVAIGEFTHAAGLLPAVAFMAIGLGLAGTAVTGRRRYGLPLLAALLMTVLARANAVGLRLAADEGLSFRHQVSDVVAEGGVEQHYLVVDAPETVGGYQVLPQELSWVFDVALGFQPQHDTLSARRISSEALLGFAREPEFDELRRKGLVVVLRRSNGAPETPVREAQPSAKVPLPQSGRWRGQALELSGLAPKVVGWRNVEPGSGEEQAVLGRGHWTGVSGDVPYLADSAAIEQLTVDVVADESTELESSPSVFWRARGALARGGDLRGVWVRLEGGRRAVFDTGATLEWLLGPRVDSLLLLGSLADAPGAEVWATPPPIAGVSDLEIRGEDWWFSPALDDTDLFDGARSEWVVTLLDLADLRYLEVPCEYEPGEGLVAEDVEELVERFWSGRSRLAWALERRVGEVVLGRSGGRL
jgi:hypothetical protein